MLEDGGIVTHAILLDTSSLMYRAYFAIPASVTDEDGRPINAVHGYLDMVARLVATRSPDSCTHCYDDNWRPAPRVEMYEGYKANRAADPPGLPEQFDVLRGVLDSLGLPQADAPGWEAEDAIGALCAVGVAQDPSSRFDVVTGDRDLIQLVRDPQVRVLFTVKGVTELRILDEAGVEERYGVPPSRYADLALLRGDPSDGLPGVRGVGEKTALAMARAYPSIEAMLEDAARPRPSTRPLAGSPALRARVREAADYLRVAKEIIRIRTETEIRTWQPDPDEERLSQLVERHRLKGPVQRLRAAMSGAGSP
jgi:5'-3' exonuclease